MSAPAFSPKPAPSSSRAAPPAPAPAIKPSSAGAGAGVPRFASSATPAKGAPAATVSSEAVDISSGTFNPSEKVKGEISDQRDKSLDVRVFVKGLTSEGLVKVRADSHGNYDSHGGSHGKGSMPLLNPWTQQLGGMHLNFTVKGNQIKGAYASLKPGGGDTNDWLQAVQKNAELLGGLGLKVGHLPTPVNKFENGVLTLGATGLKVEVGGFLDADFNLLLENTSKLKVDGTAKINVKGIVEGTLKVDNSQDKLAGEISLAVNFKSFSGSALVKYNPDGTVDINGKAAYSADKLSGEIGFVATDVDSAKSFARSAISAAGGLENVQAAAPPEPVPAPKPGKKSRALAATGQLAFNLTNWFAGTVHVVVDGEGRITVIGKIAPPAEIELFKQRDWDNELIKFEAKAYYGIPVVGDLNLFANISLHAIAKLGPAKIYNIEILGTYSTDPEIQKNIQISGSINISAYAGLRLRAEGGLGVEILDHEIKFGVGLNADVGVKAYADARPTVGFRDPGEFYVSGTIEMVAQPMLGLGGDFFIELSTPWWSPLSDDKWIWPLFSKEWPLTDPIGLSATVKEYVLGSGKVPEIEFKKPEFDPSKFMTSMVDKTLPDKSGGHDAGQGAFKEDGTVQKPVVPPKKPAPPTQPRKAGKKGTPPKGGKSGKPDPKSAKEKDAGTNLKKAADRVGKLKGKYSREELNTELSKIKGQLQGVEFDVQEKPGKWTVTPKAGNKPGKKAVELAAKEPSQKHPKPGTATDEKGGEKKIQGPLHVPEPFTNAAGETHTLSFKGTGLDADLIVESTPMVLATFLANYKPKNDDEKKALTQIKTNATKINNIKENIKAGKRSYGKEAGEEIRELFEAIVKWLKELGTNEAPPVTKVEWPPTERTAYGDGRKMIANPLTLNPGKLAGSQPYATSELWLAVNKRKDTYIRGHLLNHHVHGPGSMENLIPITSRANRQMETQVESTVKHAVIGEKKVVRYEVEAVGQHGGTRKYVPKESELPVQLVLTAEELTKQKDVWMPLKNRKGVILNKHAIKNELPDDTPV